MNHTTDERAALLHAWISRHYPIVENSFMSVSGDASFRRYFRFTVEQTDGSDNLSLIAVDAPPELENSQPFLDIAQLLATNNLSVPIIYEHDLQQGFYIQQDFGDQLLLDLLNGNSVDSFYQQAMQDIAHLQHVECDQLPLYNSQLLHREMNLFTEWYLANHLNVTLNEIEKKCLQACYQLLEANAVEQPQVFVHRDYHSRNLMVLDNNTLGMIDFQDAVKGPITYDLVSLLRDCYIAWPQDKINQWLSYFHTYIVSAIPIDTFTRWFDLMGMQRHLKATGIFCRLHYRDDKPGYLNDIPRTMNYIKQVSAKYPELNEFNQLVSKL